MSPDEVIERMMLDRLKHGNARLPRTWKTVRHYERLVVKGLAVEVDDPNPLLRVFASVKTEDAPRA
jgi:hypothetical protein